MVGCCSAWLIVVERGRFTLLHLCGAIFVVRTSHFFGSESIFIVQRTLAAKIYSFRFQIPVNSMTRSVRGQKGAQKQNE
jgi:hypothetical protein